MIFTSLVVALTLVPPGRDLGQDTTSVARTIIQLEDAWRAAQWHTDTAAFLRLLAPDVTFIGTSGSFRTRAEYIASRTGSTIPQATAFAVTELKVRLFGGTVVVTGRATTTGPHADSARFTDVWAWRDSRWQLVAVQRTDVVPADE